VFDVCRENLRPKSEKLRATLIWHTYSRQAKKENDPNFRASICFARGLILVAPMPISFSIEKGTPMTSQVFNQFEVETPQPFMLRDILPGPAWAPFRAAPQVAAVPAEQALAPAAKTQHRWKTVAATICFEVAIPLGVLSIWQFWSHLR
jgi:hypothetical protein